MQSSEGTKVPCLDRSLSEGRLPHSRSAEDPVERTDVFKSVSAIKVEKPVSTSKVEKVRDAFSSSFKSAVQAKTAISSLISPLTPRSLSAALSLKKTPSSADVLSASRDSSNATFPPRTPRRSSGSSDHNLVPVFERHIHEATWLGHSELLERLEEAKNQITINDPDFCDVSERAENGNHGKEHISPSILFADSSNLSVQAAQSALGSYFLRRKARMAYVDAVDAATTLMSYIRKQVALADLKVQNSACKPPLASKCDDSGSWLTREFSLVVMVTRWIAVLLAIILATCILLIRHWPVICAMSAGQSPLGERGTCHESGVSPRLVLSLYSGILGRTASLITTGAVITKQHDTASAAATATGEMTLLGDVRKGNAGTAAQWIGWLADLPGEAYALTAEHSAGWRLSDFLALNMAMSKSAADGGSKAAPLAAPSAMGATAGADGSKQSRAEVLRQLLVRSPVGALFFRSGSDRPREPSAAAVGQDASKH